MYAEYFGLTEPGFSITPDPQYLFLSTQHREALAHLLYGAEGAGGFVQLTGEVGTGKTTVCRAFLQQLPGHVDIALILNPALTVSELLRAVCTEFGVKVSESVQSVQELVGRLNEYLLEAHAEGRRPILLIDEAQSLSAEVLEQVRLLTNLETEKHKLLQIFLIGQPELRELLRQPHMRQVAQRVTARYHLEPLRAGETQDYIEHRLAIAGAQRALFLPAAMRRVHRLTKGVPRLINILCDRSLLGAYATGRRIVTPGIVSRAYRELQGERAPKHGPIAKGLGITGLIAVMLATAWWMPGREELFGSMKGHRDAAVEPPVVQESSVGEQEEPQAVAELPRSEPIDASPPELPGSEPIDEGRPELSLADLSWERDEAVIRLFEAWGGKPTEELRSDPCAVVEKQSGLACHASDGGWEALRRYNLPAVLSIGEEGRSRFLVLVALGPRTAVAIGPHGEASVPVDLLETRWAGEFLILWKLAPDGERLIRWRSSPATVEWLRTQVERALGEEPTEGSGSYDAALLALVARFQESRGLAPDGIAGPETLIQLHGVAAKAAPSLRRTDS